MDRILEPGFFDEFTPIAKAEKQREPRVIHPLVRRVLTCVPKQLTDTQEKLDWVEQQIEIHKPHIFCCPQEMWGGQVAQPHHPFVREEELLPQLLSLTKRKGIGLLTGVVEIENGVVQERFWFIDNGELKGKVSKLILPRYSLKKTKGCYDAVEEMSLDKRAVKFPIQGVEVSAVFCWEAFSWSLWERLRQVEPDFVYTGIKFGANAYPRYVVHDEKIWPKVGDFGYMNFKDFRKDPWVECLFHAANYGVLCPIFVSTNSWWLKGKSHALAGVIFDTDKLTNLWASANEDKEIPEKVIVTEYDFNRIRGMRGGKWKFYELCDANPPQGFMELTMLYKAKNGEKKKLRFDKQVTLANFSEP